MRSRGVVSSYTPTLAALTRARARPASGRVRQLAVGVPEAPAYIPGARPLPAVPDELQILASYLPPPGRATQLLGPAATRQAVLDALPGHPWLHLSCHGVQHLADAGLSAFLLYDQPLTLADLAALDLRETDVAYLAACQTAAGDVRLLDEARHLAGALQLVGYRHVLATLWSISAAAAPCMADTTYAHLCHPDPDNPDPVDQPQAARAPYALYHAITRLRQAIPGEPPERRLHRHLQRRCNSPGCFQGSLPVSAMPASGADHLAVGRQAGNPALMPMNWRMQRSPGQPGHCPDGNPVIDPGDLLDFRGSHA